MTEITERKSGSFGEEVSATMQLLLVSSYKNVSSKTEELTYISLPFCIQAHRPVSNFSSVWLVIILM